MRTEQSSAAEALTKLADSILAEEGITPEILDCVDLDVAFSPVICLSGETLRDAVTVSESLDPNRYLLKHPNYPQGFVSKDSLKIMRARFLLARQGPPNPKPILTIDTTTPEGKEAVAKLFSALTQQHENRNTPD